MNDKKIMEKLRVRPGEKVDLKKFPTEVKPVYKSKKHYLKLLEEYRQEISALQEILYAHGRYALLLIFQGMDTSGKDGAIKHVMSGINPQGCQVVSFKQPSGEELNHDFLWRTNKRLPERGRIGIFNRSYYEEVLIVRVIPEVLQKQRIPEEFVNLKEIWPRRYADIVNLEDYLHRNGTRIVKFFLHLSKEEQRRRFLKRIDAPHKNWKLTSADIDMRRHWESFRNAYEDCLGATSRNYAPWFVIPADDKRSARLIISRVILETMKSLRMDFPASSAKHREELQRARRILERE